VSLVSRPPPFPSIFLRSAGRPIGWPQVAVL
jgi:hypothetical protein